VAIAEQAVAHEHTQDSGQATPTAVTLMPMDSSGGYGVGGGPVHGTSRTIILAGQDVPGDEARVEPTAVQVMGCVH